MKGRERWRQIENFPAYDVSDLGRVRRGLASPAQGTRPGRVRKLGRDRWGYPTVGLWRDGKFSAQRVHRLVAAAFIGPPPASAFEVNHLSADKADNRPRNLEYARPGRNMQHAHALGLFKRGREVQGVKLSAAKVRRIRREHGRLSQRELARRYLVRLSTMQAVLDGRTWRWVV